MSVVLVCFPNAPKISEEAVKKEAELDKFLESRVEGKRMSYDHTLQVNILLIKLMGAISIFSVLMC